MSTTATRLDGLAVDEISGVDAGANGMPGFMVFKEAGDAERAEAQLAALYATLNGAEVLKGDDVPEDVSKARDLLTKMVEDLMVKEGEDEGFVAKMKSLFKAKAPKVDTEDDTDGGADEGSEGDPKFGSPEWKAKYGTHGKPVKKAATPDLSEYVKKADLPEVPAADTLVLKADYDEDSEVMKDALAATLERVEAVEAALTGSFNIEGTDTSAVTKSGGTLRDVILSAAQGNRVTIR